VIVLQAHWDDWFMDGTQPGSGRNARSAIPTHLLLGSSYSDLYPTMTPVNTLWDPEPLVRNRVSAAAGPGLLPRTSAFDAIQGVPESTDSCHRFEICLPAHPE
jgi:hypothetical protein